MKIDEIRAFLKAELIGIGIEENLLEDMKSISTIDLGLESVELVDISITLKEKYGVIIKLITNEPLTLENICENILEKINE